MALNVGAQDVGNRSTLQGPSKQPEKKTSVPEPDKLLFQLPQQIRTTLNADLPDDTADPADIIQACELRIDAALTVQKAIEHYGSETLFRYAGPAVRLAYRTKSWQTKVDPATDKAFRGFNPWCRRVGISKSQSYRMVNEEPVSDALRSLNPGQLTTEQVDILAPVLRQHDAARCRRVWEAATKMGATDRKTLLKARDSLELTIAEETDDDDRQPGKSKSTHPPVVRFQAGRYDRESVRTAVRSDPEFARLLARDILAELEHLKDTEQPQSS
ncbi:hypothetical protein OHA98_42335 [Streptomyces sp. NBC_00654]|uniref:hypothetical protein n=1 Tax=Streptomyces sp. NBC_00654 TaxID=2975799 RepID=UPI00225719CB|nr:hypothetical protein [Streptomyces sp. NBC_00654]MCX4971231.1 hypothetical protein [Streptomyces sp. NBC_00654]MCX4971240.1 hypothetical protein [Streptomyces sp. NBC_00654]